MTRNETSLLIGGMMAGAMMMFIMDPSAGRGRRSFVRDQAVSKVRQAGTGIKAQARHVGNRTRGLAHEARAKSSQIMHSATGLFHKSRSEELTTAGSARPY